MDEKISKCLAALDAAGRAMTGGSTPLVNESDGRSGRFASHTAPRSLITEGGDGSRALDCGQTHGGMSSSFALTEDTVAGSHHNTHRVLYSQTSDG